MNPISENPIKDTTDLNSTKSFDLVGGKKEWKSIINRLGQTIEQQTPSCGEDPVDLAYELKKPFELTKPRVIDPLKYSNIDELLNAVEFFWINRLRKRKTTFNRYRSLLFSMANDPNIPINLFNLDPDQIVAHLDFFEDHYEKQTDRNGKDAVINRWKAIKTLAKSYGKTTENWNYVPPEKGKPKHKIIPLPGDVYRIFHYEYSEDPYENALYQYLAYHGFLVGWRIPSEPAILKLDDIHLDEGYIHFYQPKVETKRLTPLEPEIMTMFNRKSFKNWIDKWRPKVENQYSEDFVYLEPSGKPFSANYLRNRINELVKRAWPDFHPRVCRDWCSIARLIQKDYNIKETCDWMEHSDLRVTEHYTKDAKRYYTMAPYDWIKSVLKSPNYWREENGLKSINGLKTSVSNGNSPRRRSGPMGI